MTMKSASTRVLLIEDEPHYVALLERKLTVATEPFQVESASSLGAGIEKIRQTGFDAVVLDLNLPDSRGSDTVVRMHETAPDLPIVVLSGLDDDTTVYDVLHCGAQEYLYKEPSAVNSLPRTIAHAIERKRVDLALKQSTDRWRALFEHSPIQTIVVDRDGRVTDFNAAKCASGDRLPAVGDRMYVDYAARHDRDMRGELMQCIETGERREFPEQRYGNKVLSINIAPFPKDNPEGAIITSQDITARKRAEDALRESKELFEKTFTSQRDAIFVLDASIPPIILDCNPAAIEVFGYTRQEMLGRTTVFLHVNETTLGKFQEDLYPAIEERGFLHLPDFEMKRKDGTVFPTEHSVMPLEDEQGKRIGWVSVVQDITERLGLEAQIRQSQKLESIGTLAGGVAHEINNPINGIMNYAQLILDKLGPDSPVSEFATQIGKETRRVATIVRNLLSFSRPAKDEHSPARVCDIVEATLSLIRGTFLGDQITLEVDVPEDLPKIKCRSQQIQQVIMNLLTNARDALNEKYPEHDKDKKIIISARELPIADCRLPIEQSGEEQSKETGILKSQIANLPAGAAPQALQAGRKSAIRLTVEDHGLGIPKKTREHLFDPFYTSKRPGRGTGLGLSISYTIVTEHGGELSVESKVGKWTRFRVDLPIAPRLRSGQADRASRSAEEAKMKGQECQEG